MGVPARHGKRKWKYAKGDAINRELSFVEWSGSLWKWHGSSLCPESYDKLTKLINHSLLCNWHTIGNANGLCPSGWHVPESWEWMDLNDILGGSEVAGNLIKAKAEDAPNRNGSDTSRFSAFASGHRHWQWSYFDIGGLAYFWSSTFSIPGSSFVQLTKKLIMRT